ncbi:MAG: hypothetical protein WAM39_32175 [Bryobacteraceae bacterium]
MLRRLLLAVLLLAGILSRPAKAAHSGAPPSPLWLYQGSWQVTHPNAGAPGEPYQLTNDCAQLGLYFACQQSVNGKPVRLLIMISTDKPGHFHTQTILPEGRATGLDDLEISGNQWVFTSSRREGGKTTYYRTINTFSGKNKIHFEQAESTDGKQWTTKSSGDEAKVSNSRAH